MKIAVPWPTKPDSQPRIKESLKLWENKELLVVCLAEKSEDPFLDRFCTMLMPRNSTSIGGKFGKCYVYDMLDAIRKKFPEEDWYGICNSDCVPVGDILEDDTKEVLIYHRTDVPNWQYRYNAEREEPLPKPILDQIWEMRQGGLTDKKIARKLNRLEIKPPGKNVEWTYLLLRDLFFEQGTVFFWGQDMYLFRADVIDRVLDEYLKVKDPIIGAGGFDERLTKWCLDNTQAARVINKIFHKAHTSEWTTDDVEYQHNGGNLSEEEKLDYAQETFLLSMSEFGQKDAVSKFVKNWAPHIVENPLSFVTTEKMITASHLLTAYLPPDIDAIVGIARSGLIPASFLACHYHVPLYSVSDGNVIDCGHGTRYTNKHVPEPAKVLLMDDTVFAGRTMKKVLPIVREAFPKSHIIKAAVYATPQAKHIVDYFACELAEPHYLEWNIFNGWPGQNAIYDMDGILCRDIAPENDDDGERYLYALKNASPKFLPRRRPIAMVVTARLERYRNITLSWLDQHRIKVDKLVMGPWRTLAERNRPMEVSKFKAKVYSETQYELFIESCPIQAKEIAKLTGRRVLCPDAGRVFT